MINFKERYSDLCSNHVDKISLKLKESRGDDLGTSIYPEFNNSNLSLFLLSLKSSSNGFVESYLLDDESSKKIKVIRNKISENVVLKKELIELLEQYLNITYDKFRFLSLGDQIKMVGNDEYIFNKKIEELICDDYKIKSLIRR